MRSQQYQQDTPDEEGMHVLAAFASLFVQRADQYAVQQRDGSYWRVAAPLTLAHLHAHLHGRWTLGTYLLAEDSTCTFAVLDADTEDGLDGLAALSAELAHQGIASLLEASRRGGHLWLHFTVPTPAHQVRSWLLPYANAYGVELYPKQDTLSSGGSGSLIRVPLGIHQRARGWFPFVQVRNGRIVPVAETVMACCEWACQHVERVTVPYETADATNTLDGSLGHSEQEVALAPSPVMTAPVHGAIRAWCHEQDIVAVIGRFVALNRAGVGSCPFTEHHYRGDVRPSFQVFGGNDPHWYCYTWGRAGDLFDFLCLYYRLTPHEGWSRLSQGTLL